MTRSSTSNTLRRRRFFSQCACACAGCTAAGSLLRPGPLCAAKPAHAGGKPKIRLVFCETTNDKPIWPNIGYDFEARRKQVLDLLGQGCPDVEFLTTILMEDPAQLAELLAADDEVDGYLVCVQGLGWRNNIFRLTTTGKPSLLVDNLFGGSGLFLTQMVPIMSSGKPVDWVSSSNDEDIVASARRFQLLSEGKSADEVAAAFRQARRDGTPSEIDWSCEEDAVETADFEEALAQLKQAKILVVGGGWGGDNFRKAAADVVGVTFVPTEFETVAAAYEEVGRREAQAQAERWMADAQEVVEPDRAEIEKSAAMYLAMKVLMDAQGATGISVNCLGGFYGGHLKAYPCLGFSQLNNDGLVGGCEADQMSALTMAAMGALVGRPGFISDPVIDTSNSEIIYAHCVAMTKPFGVGGPSNPYRIRTHSEDRNGASIQSLLPSGYMTTTLELNPSSRQMLFHRAKTTGNNPSDMACRTKLEAVVQGDIEKLTEQWRMGWHRVTFYGDLKPQVVELCDRLKLELIEEA